MTDTAPILAWHFVSDTLRDGSPIPPDGEWQHYKGECVMCESGLHASRSVLDALQYAPGSTICRVACAGIAEEQSDKLVSTHRFILWRLDGEEVLRAFARQQALSAIHLWDAPQVVKDYLTTQDESLRDAARVASRDAARDAAWNAASDAASAASWASSWAAASAATRAAPWAATRDAAWAAARAMAWDAVKDTAFGFAARNAAVDAALAEARAKASDTLTRMVLETRGNPDDEALLRKVPKP